MNKQTQVKHGEKHDLYTVLLLAEVKITLVKRHMHSYRCANVHVIFWDA